MYPTLAILAVIALAYVAARLARTPFSGPLVLLVVGLLLGPVGVGALELSAAAARINARCRSSRNRCSPCAGAYVVIGRLATPRSVLPALSVPSLCPVLLFTQLVRLVRWRPEHATSFLVRRGVDVCAGCRQARNRAYQEQTGEHSSQHLAIAVHGTCPFS